MPFSKRFPKNVPGSAYPQWEASSLSAEEEKTAEEKARQENIKMMKECISDAKIIVIDTGLKPFQANIVKIATTLFEKRASHAVYHKEAKAKEKFDSGSQN